MALPITKKIQQLTQSQTVEEKRLLVIRKLKNYLNNTFYYLLLLSLSFVFIYPLLYMISQSFMRPQDVADATVQWIPKMLTFENYVEAYKALKYWHGFLNSVWISLGSGILQIFSCALIGYGFARYKFPGKGILMGLLVFTFLVPPQTIVVPLYIFYSDLGWINTIYPFLFPSLTGFGLKGALYVLIFIQFFRGLPQILEEAARIDGAGAFRTYWQIMFPLAQPAIIVVFLLSVVWHWNDIFQPNLYLMLPEFYNLAQNLSVFNGTANADGLNQLQNMISSSDAIGLAPTRLNQVLAGVILTILPILILYLFLQRSFIASVDKTGISGE